MIKPLRQSEPLFLRKNFEASVIVHGPNGLLRFAIREKRFVFALELLTQLKKLLKLMMPRLTPRINAPKRWMLDKTTGVFAPKPSSGPHKARECLSLVLILRNQTQMPQLQTAALTEVETADLDVSVF
ncbi:40S ribosomal protein S4 [Tanacetum coccineum]